MGLIITETELKKIKIHGVSFQLPSVYVRLKPYFHFDGVKMEADVQYYETKESFKLETESVKMNIPVLFQGENGELGSVDSIIGSCKELETQSMDTIHLKAKEVFESLGYFVVVEL